MDRWITHEQQNKHYILDSCLIAKATLLEIWGDVQSSGWRWIRGWWLADWQEEHAVQAGRLTGGQVHEERADPGLSGTKRWLILSKHIRHCGQVALFLKQRKSELLQALESTRWEINQRENMLSQDTTTTAENWLISTYGPDTDIVLLSRGEGRMFLGSWVACLLGVRGTGKPHRC